MSVHKPLVVDFKEIDKGDLPLVGGKGANLGEMVKEGFPVPGGFAVTVVAYDRFLDENDLHDFLKKTLKDLDVDNPESLEKASKTIQKKFEKSHIPDDVAKEVFRLYKKIPGGLIAARSSATAEDLPDASFAGQQATFLNVKGEANVMNKVRLCWASLYTARAIFYREQNNIKHEDVKISVIVQQMVQSVVSGVMFTIDPVTNDKETIIIEAVWGLGELIVQGAVVPDRYKVQKGTLMTLSKEISTQDIQLTMVGTETKEREVPMKIRDSQKIPDEMITLLAKIGDKLQKHYYFPQDVEWAYGSDKKLYITQTRPVTTIGKKVRPQASELKDDDGNIIKTAGVAILTGSAASPGIGVGHVRIIKSAKEIGKVKKGDVLVSTMTSPDFVPAMKRASAIVTDQGGQTSHAAIVSRELGIPAIVGTHTATEVLKNGDIITVDGTKGRVYRGSKIKLETKKPKDEKPPRIRTATNLYVNLAEESRIKDVADKYVDGVGLLRAEFMVAEIGIHPKEAIKNKKQDIFIKKLVKGLTKFTKAFYPRPVVYRATDFKTNEYRALPGGKHWEPEEPNPMLGFRGAARYIAQPEVFNLEIQAMKKVREKYDNLWLMAPFVRSPEELRKIRRLLAAEGMFEKSSFKFWMMVELPVNVIMLNDFIDIGIDGVSIGSNDLTMLLLGTDRDNADVASAFNERDPVVSWAIKRTIKTCLKRGITSSICGQAPSTYDDMVEDLVKWGITSISVNPDAIGRVRRVIAEAEKKVAGG